MKQLRRSMLFLPASNAAMLSTAFIYKPDSIMFDLEDAISIKEKDSARLLVSQVLQLPIYKKFNIETVVRINALDTVFGMDDLEAVVRAGVDVVRLPMTHSAEDIHCLESHIEHIEKKCQREVGSTKIMAGIESAEGIINAVSIAKSSSRMIGIALAAFDYLLDMQTFRGDGSELFYARCMVLHAARAAKIDAFDAVYSDVNDDENFLREVRLIKQLGFNGKSLINPRQIELLHNEFAPTEKEVDYANEVVLAAEDGERLGFGIVSLNGKMIDAPIVTRARMVLELAKVSGLRKEC